MKATIPLAIKSEPLPVSPEAAPAELETRVRHPSVYLSEIPGIEKLPTGEFEARVKFRTVRRSESTITNKEGTKEDYTIELELLEITPDTVSASEDGESGKEESVEDALDSFLAKSTS